MEPVLLMTDFSAATALFWSPAARRGGFDAVLMTEGADGLETVGSGMGLGVGFYPLWMTA